MEIDWDLKAKLYKEYLENGGYEKIFFPELLQALLKVKTLPNGSVDPKTVNSVANSAMLAYVGSQLIEPFNSDKYLSQYETLLQKSIFFSQITIETRDEFDNIFEEFQNVKHILFRGLNEAKYRLYSSLQREWKNSKLYEKHKSYDGFLKKLIKNARVQNGNVLSKYLEKIGIDPENDLAVLSFLQHYGCPTPLLDWTYSFLNALYFAMENVKKSLSGWEIEKYFCVYYLEEEFFEQASMQKSFEIGLDRQKGKLKDDFTNHLKESGIIKDFYDKLITPQHIDKMFYMLHGKDLMTYITKIERLARTPMLYFSDDKTDEFLKYNLNTNMNIINQNGVFTWNSSPTKPIEHIPFEISRKKGTENKVLFSKCININKDLVKYIKKKITKLGVTESFIYPDSWKLAKQTFKMTK